MSDSWCADGERLDLAITAPGWRAARRVVSAGSLAPTRGWLLPETSGLYPARRPVGATRRPPIPRSS